MCRYNNIMAYLKIHHDILTTETADKLIGLCPFSSISYNGGMLEISPGCTMCRLCVSDGPAGVVTFVDGEDG